MLLLEKPLLRHAGIASGVNDGVQMRRNLIGETNALRLKKRKGIRRDNILFSTMVAVFIMRVKERQQIPLVGIVIVFGDIIPLLLDLRERQPL
jgi:hypothetical protein